MANDHYLYVTKEDHLAEISGLSCEVDNLHKEISARDYAIERLVYQNGRLDDKLEEMTHTIRVMSAEIVSLRNKLAIQNLYRTEP